MVFHAVNSKTVPGTYLFTVPELHKKTSFHFKYAYLNTYLYL